MSVAGAQMFLAPDAPRLAAILAHPDDESRIMGGTLARHAVGGWRLGLYCATRGEAGDPSQGADQVGKLREGELEAACRTLGITQVHLGRLPDGGLASVKPSAILEDLVRYLRLFRPVVVLTFGPDGRDGHQDHITIGRLAQEAFDLSGRTDVFGEHAALGLSPWRPDRLYESAVARSVAEQFGWPHATAPDSELVRVDTTDVFDCKVQAVVRDHASQWRLSPWNSKPSEWRARGSEFFRLTRSAAGSSAQDGLL